MLQREHRVVPNPYLIKRLEALRGVMLHSYAGGASLSSASRGREREAFVNVALENVIAPPFRIGSGDITDSAGNRTGQLDTVIEFASSISFPMLSGAPRLYLAEGVCAVLEIKSDLSNQWNEVESARTKISAIKRNFGASITIGGTMPATVPHIAVGFTGWKALKTVEDKRRDSGLDGILFINEQLFVGGGYTATGPFALYTFFVLMQRLTTMMLGASGDYLAYVRDPAKP